MLTGSIVSVLEGSEDVFEIESTQTLMVCTLFILEMGEPGFEIETTLAVGSVSVSWAADPPEASRF